EVIQPLHGNRLEGGGQGLVHQSTYTLSVPPLTVAANPTTGIGLESMNPFASALVATRPPPPSRAPAPLVIVASAAAVCVSCAPQKWYGAVVLNCAVVRQCIRPSPPSGGSRRAGSTR